MQNFCNEVAHLIRRAFSECNIIWILRIFVTLKQIELTHREFAVKGCTILAGVSWMQ